MIVFSPTSCAAVVKASGAMGGSGLPAGLTRFRPLVYLATVSGVPPVRPMGAFMPKYMCWSITQAVIIAAMATKLSVSMPP